ncbi:hypothetical protein ABT214_00485 [Micromonospora purpureochromogenes]|uniref:hypothetical protein n=1 Tax=Micromonospora purpureochromogenes TaxID=47872 RepID=UPI00332E6192
MDETGERLRAAGREFLAAAWEVLQEQRVVPPPVFHPYVEVGRDYYGDAVRSSQYRALESVIEAAHPRFHPDRPLGEREFPSGYIFTFLESFIARLTISREEFSVEGPAATQALQDLEDAVRADTVEVACCRVVSHLTTASGHPIDFVDLRVVPVTAEAHQHRSELQAIISDAIPGATSAYSREDPGGYAPPESVVIARDRGPKPFELGERLSGRIERFLLLVRLLKPGTSESMFEVVGETRPVRQFRPTLGRFRGAGPGSSSPTQLAARAITLRPEDVGRVAGLDALMASVEHVRPGMLFTSFGLALHKFMLSYHAHAWHEQIVDLATAFEAALSGKSHNDVTLRLKVRASGLLVTERDPADAIFKDIGLLYGIRSTLVHGGEAKTTGILKQLRGLSTMPKSALDGEATGHAVERLRDLVRRALLARICLAAGEEPRWSLAGDNDSHVDVALADDVQRSEWRAGWREELSAIGALASADRPTVPSKPAMVVLDEEKDEGLNLTGDT